MPGRSIEMNGDGNRVAIGDEDHEALRKEVRLLREQVQELREDKINCYRIIKILASGGE